MEIFNAQRWDDLARFKDKAVDWATPAMVKAALTGMSLGLRFHPGLRGQLAGVHPMKIPWVFEASFLFASWDLAHCIHAVFKNGTMKVGSGPLQSPDVTVRFPRLEHMRKFFISGGDPLLMMLNKEIAVDGNITYLAKFGHMAAALKLGGRKMAPGAGKDRGNGDVTGGRSSVFAFAPPPSEIAVGHAGKPCPSRPEGEVKHIEDPYLAGYTLNDFPRIKELLWVHRYVPPEICIERAALVTEALLNRRLNGGSGGKAPSLIQGETLHHLFTNKQAIVNDDDLFLGTTTSKKIGVVLYPETHGTTIWPELLTMEARSMNPYRISEEEIRVLDKEVFPFWSDLNIREFARKANGNPEAMRLDERFVFYFLWKVAAVSHTIADMPMMLKKGLAEIRRDAENRLLALEGEAVEDGDKETSGKKDFYRAVMLVLDGVMDYAQRLARKARQKAELIDPGTPSRAARREELLEMARICEKVPAGPATSYREALQAVWLVFCCLHQESTNAGLSVGRLDLWFQPFLDELLSKAGSDQEKKERIEEALELLCAFMLKFTDHLPLVPELGNRLFGGSSSDQVITLGGVKSDGQTAVCDMTWLFLKATEMLRLRDPNMNARYTPNVNSKEYLRRLCEVNLLTRATPSIHNDDAMLPALTALGFPIEDARDWGATGCVEPTMCGRHMGHTNCMMFNMVAAFEMALNNGVHPSLNEQVGPATGYPRTFPTYELFLDAYKKQLCWLLQKSVEGNNLLGRAHQQIKPTPLLSSLIQGTLDAGKDIIDGGARYNTSGVAMIGLTDVVDSLAAIKMLVYDRKRVDFSTLLKALEADFVGFEELHAEILAKVPKFGSDNELPRSIAADIIDAVYAYLTSQSNYRGGRYLPGYWSMSNHVAFGLFSGALPSGRRKGKAFTPGLTPSPLSHASLTEQISTVAGLDRHKLPNNIAFNVKVVPGANDRHETVLDRMAAYLTAYIELGGMQMQFNVVDSKTLRDAMQNPAEYRDLLVRISGYNAYFVDLNRDMQIELIERTEHQLGG